MKNKKGFILIETIVVMVVVMVALIGLYSMYVTIIKNSTQRQYYDNINDVYRLNVIKELVGDDFLSSNSFRSIDPSGCTTYNSDCLDIITFLVEVEEEESDIRIILIPSGFESLSIASSHEYNGLIRYLETTNYKGNKLIILRYKKDGNEYFASLEV